MGNRKEDMYEAEYQRWNSDDEADKISDNDDDNDNDDEFESEEKDVEENEEEMSQIESKIDSGEDLATASDTSLLLKARVIYLCPISRKIFFKNKWIKDNVTDVYTVRTELAICDQYLKRAQEYGYFIGSLEIYDKKLKERKNVIIDLAKSVEAELENKMPFEVIIDTREQNDILYIFTNTTRLAIEIARAVRHEWHGAIQYEWFERNQFVRAKWFSEVQNREYFKSRIKAAKEKRVGMFSFEDE